MNLSLINYFRKLRATRNLQFALNVLLLPRRELIQKLTADYSVDWSDLKTGLRANSFAVAILMILAYVKNTLHKPGTDNVESFLGTIWDNNFLERPDIFELISQVGCRAYRMESTKEATSGLTVMFLNEIAKYYFEDNSEHQKRVFDHLSQSVSLVYQTEMNILTHNAQTTGREINIAELTVPNRRAYEAGQGAGHALFAAVESVLNDRLRRFSEDLLIKLAKRVKTACVNPAISMEDAVRGEQEKMRSELGSMRPGLENTINVELKDWLNVAETLQLRAEIDNRIHERIDATFKKLTLGGIGMLSDVIEERDS